jgi:hypothetical protein
MFTAFAGFGLIFLILGLLASIFWIWMLVVALTSEPTPTEKLLWFLVIFFLHILGALIYFFMRYQSRGTRPVL